MMRRLVGLAFIGTMLLVATSMVATAATSPNAMVTAKVKAAGISLRYPKSWVLVPLTKKALAAEVKALAKTNPKAASAVAGTDVSQFKLRVLDPAAGGAQNMGVQFIQGQGSPSSLADFKRVIPTLKSDGATVLDTKAVKVSGKAAYRIDMTQPVKLPDGSVVVERLAQLAVPQGDNATYIDAAAFNSDSGVAVINSILATVSRL